MLIVQYKCDLICKIEEKKQLFIVTVAKMQINMLSIGIILIIFFQMRNLHQQEKVREETTHLIEVPL